MIRDITIGQYYAAKSPVHDLDPRTKLMALLLYVILLFFVKQPVWYVPFALVLAFLYHLSNIPARYVMRGLQTVAVLLCFTFFFRMTLTPGTELAHFWIFSITNEGIYKAIRLTVRIALMVTGASLLSYTSTPRELADGLEKGLGFLRRLGVPLHSMAVILMIAFRFIPIMLEEMNILMDAQAARGAEFHKCSVVKKCKNVVSLLMPLFFSTVRRSADLALAMIARGYQEGAETTRMYPLEYAKGDRIAQWSMGIFFLIMLTVLLTVQ